MGSSGWRSTADPLPAATPFTPRPANVASVMSSHLRHHGTRPDWILYIVPGAAFLLGLGLFTLLLRTCRHRQPAVQQRMFNRQRQADPKYPHHRTDTEDILQAGAVGVSTADTVSYENVDTGIYANQLAAEDSEDYLTPDADTGHSGSLPPLCCHTDTDGGSYENMEGAVYAEPRKRGTTSAPDDRDDRDYLELDVVEEGQDGDCGDYLCPVKEPWDTDGESYEDMDRPLPAGRHEEEDSYEKMDSIPAAQDVLEAKRRV
ncbi:hypothetical protein GN956_G3080 [Arapaima gigas]